METVTITKASLEVVLLSWAFEQQRAGKLGDDVPPAAIASSMVSALWPMLQADERRRIFRVHGLAGQGSQA